MPTYHILISTIATHHPLIRYQSLHYLKLTNFLIINTYQESPMQNVKLFALPWIIPKITTSKVFGWNLSDAKYFNFIQLKLRFARFDITNPVLPLLLQVLLYFLNKILFKFMLPNYALLINITDRLICILCKIFQSIRRSF